MISQNGSWECLSDFSMDFETYLRDKPTGIDPALKGTDWRGWSTKTSTLSIGLPY